MTNIILLGAGGHCKSAIEIIETLSDYQIKGVLDANEKGFVFEYPILGSDDQISSFAKDNNFIITVGSIKSTKIREHIAKKVLNSNGIFATVISKNAIVSKRATIKFGTLIFNFAHINSNCQIGENCILNTSCNIEHDCSIGDFTHVSTGAMINGGCKIGKRCFIGSNATIANCINICDDVIIGAGAVVINDICGDCTIGAGALIIKDINEPGTYVGNPIRRIDMKKNIMGGHNCIVKVYNLPNWRIA